MVVADRDALHKAIDELPDESLSEVQALLTYLQYRRTHPGSAWFRALYDVFEPVRRDVAASDMTEDEINAIIDEAIEEVRRERDS
jgi:hypothetical protein